MQRTDALLCPDMFGVLWSKPGHRSCAENSIIQIVSACLRFNATGVNPRTRGGSSCGPLPILRIYVVAAGAGFKAYAGLAHRHGMAGSYPDCLRILDWLQLLGLHGNSQMGAVPLRSYHRRGTGVLSRRLSEWGLNRRLSYASEGRKAEFSTFITVARDPLQIFKRPFSVCAHARVGSRSPPAVRPDGPGAASGRWCA